MKTNITFPETTKIWWYNISTLLTKSLQDLGHTLTELEKAELVIFIQAVPPIPSLQKESGKKYILLQVEQNDHPSAKIECYRKFWSKEYKDPIYVDKVWGFNIENPDEDYFVLGYHPYLENTEPIVQDITVNFFGCPTERRIEFFNSVTIRPAQRSSWNFPEKLLNIKRTKINLNYHAYGPTNFTEWDRICLIFANNGFLLSEQFYCPLPVVQFVTNEEYNKSTQYYLNHHREREDMAHWVTEQYKKQYDMRNILQEKLKCL